MSMCIGASRNADLRHVLSVCFAISFLSIT